MNNYETSCVIGISVFTLKIYSYCSTNNVRVYYIILLGTLRITCMTYISNTLRKIMMVEFVILSICLVNSVVLFKTFKQQKSVKYLLFLGINETFFIKEKIYKPSQSINNPRTKLILDNKA